jgi:uncharacterized protein (DUF1778 family)
LSPKDWQRFRQALDRPVKPKPRLKRLFAESTVLDER